MRKRRSGRGGAGKIVRRTVALFLAGVTGWMLWLTADFSAAGEALKALGDNVRLTAALLTAELGRVAEDGPLAGMTGWERMVLNQSALLAVGKDAVAALSAQAGESEMPAPDPEDTAEVQTTTAPSNIVEQTLTGSDSTAYVSADGVYARN